MESGFIAALLFLKVKNMQEESKLLFKIIDSLIKENLKNISYDKEGLIVGIDGNGNTLSVVIDKQKYSIKNGTNISFNIMDKCLVHYINGNSSSKIVIARM